MILKVGKFEPRSKRAAPKGRLKLVDTDPPRKESAATLSGASCPCSPGSCRRRWGQMFQLQWLTWWMSEYVRMYLV